jgi:DNA modification methylase
MILTGDCVEEMAKLDADSVDAVVTDPPYGLGFMGKAWDSPEGNGSWTRAGTAIGVDHRTTSERSGSMKAGSYDRSTASQHAFQAWCELWATEAYRVAKPGAHLLAFGGTRTYHRLASAIEDAGWEIRDCLVWAYASGFPKSLDVSKAIDKGNGHWRGRAGAVTVEQQAAKGTEYARTPKGDPVTAEAVRWAGWGTALKPAWEPIVMARKPLRGTVAANVQRYGTGALNIDGTRIPTSEADRAAIEAPNGFLRAGYQRPRTDGTFMEGTATATAADGTLGRWPPNLLLTDPLFDGTDVVGGEPGYSRFYIVPKAARSDREPLVRGELAQGELRTMGDGANGHDPARPIQRANVHPTVKPVELMRHLVRLVTPPGGVVLDCFLGSGSTAIAAELEGFAWIGIEKEPEYVAIAEARLNGTQRGFSW